MPAFRVATALVVFLIAGSSVSARQPVRARHAMIVAQEPLAADVGLAVLKTGGNALDAAVATAFALAVTHPFAGNIGGGGFALLRASNGETKFLDFREAAPLAATRNMYIGPDGKATRDSQVGWRAAGVPGTVRGLEQLHRWGARKPWAELVAPAIRLANDGFEVSWALSQSLRTAENLLSKFPESKRIFLKNGAYYEAGETLRQPELARTLERIAHHGAAGFYEGETAKLLATAMKANGGLITEADLRGYRAVERQPLRGRYRGYEVLTAPPPSSGGVGLLEMMGVLEGSGYERTGAGSASAIHFVAETMRRYYADRNAYIADPDFVRVPVSGLTDAKYVAALRASIDREHATPSADVRPGKPAGSESTETTHFSIVDAEGNAIALTYTINGGYGNGVTVPGLGFLLNNEMDDFAAQPGAANMFGLVQGEANAIQPKKRPLSSMTPTILARDGQTYLVIGAPGGARIITAVLQVILNIVDFRMNVQDAIDWPRFHHQWQPDKLYLERGISPDTAALLVSMGHTIEGVRPPSGATTRELLSTVGRVEAILVEDGWLQGGTDGRGSGKAIGY